MNVIKIDKAVLRKFGLTMSLCFAVITLIIFLRHKHSIGPVSVISLLFLLFALSAPVLLKCLYILWMKIGFILSRFNTKLLLFIIFYFIFTPVGLVMRLLKIDLLDEKFLRTGASYWKLKEPKEFVPSDYERQS